MMQKGNKKEDGVIEVNVKERIITINILNEIDNNPKYAKKVGIAGCLKCKKPNEKKNKKLEK